jgi:hypothetical protein
VTLLVLLAVVSPVLRDRDSFPLSTYPMYAGTQPDTVAFSTVVGVDTGGARAHLSLQDIARTDDPLIGQARVEQAIDDGRAAALCAEVAGRASDDVARIEVVTERHDVDALAADRESLVDRTLHASCETTT